MSHYWAKFIRIGTDVFRFDTRIYFSDVLTPHPTDICIGAIVGKNPGSAIPKGDIYGSLVEIDLNGDKLLPCVKNIFLKAITAANKSINPNSYIQVLNLMYICDNNLENAITKINNCKNPLYCTTENGSFGFVWYVWGNEKKELNSYKKRFNSMNTNCQFYFNTKSNKILFTAPGHKEPARHTQGLSHSNVVPYIANII